MQPVGEGRDDFNPFIFFKSSFKFEQICAKYIPSLNVAYFHTLFLCSKTYF